MGVIESPGGKGPRLNPTRLKSWMPLAVRLGVAALLLCALWNPHWRARSDPIAAVVMLDESMSMAESRRVEAWQTIVSTLGNLPAGSRLSLVRFGAEALVESADLPISQLHKEQPPLHQAALNASGTDIEAALRSAARLVSNEAFAALILVTDGGETAGDAGSLLASFPTSGLPTPFLLYEDIATTAPDARIDAVRLPARVSAGGEFSAVLRVSSNQEGAAEIAVSDGAGRTQTVPIDLVGGETSILRVPLAALPPGFHELEFTVALPGDSNPSNNQRIAIVEVGKGANVVYVTLNPSAILAESLRAGGWDLLLIRPEHFSQILPRISGSTTVILDNVATGDMAESAWASLTESVRTRGTGLIVLGGPRSFGAGGYLNSTLESVLPVTSEAGAPLSQAAVLFVVDKSGSMGRGTDDATPFDLARMAVLAASQLLGERDFSGIIAFDIDPETWLPLAEHADPEGAARAAWRAAPSGGTRIAPALKSAIEQLADVPTNQRLLLLVTDGFAVEDDYSEVLRGIEDQEVDLVALAIGEEPAIDVLQQLTSRNDGQLLRVDDVLELPRLVGEVVGTRRLAFEGRAVQPRQERQPPFLSESVAPWPELNGYMVTKERSAARVYLRSHRGDPLLADQEVGLGRVVVLPGGLGDFAPAWGEWPFWAPFAGGLVEWSGNRFGADRISIKIDQGRGGTWLEIDALAPDGGWLARDSVRVRLSNPVNRVAALEAEAVAPGKYRLQLPLRHTGRHRITVQAGGASLSHEFFHNAPAEMNAGARAEENIRNWLASGLVRPWPAGNKAPFLGEVKPHSTRPFFIAAAALLYGFILFARLGSFFAPSARGPSRSPARAAAG
jgi:Mg-chelatase subunit ChlD